MRIVNLPNQGDFGHGPFVQFSDDEHLDIDESLALAERTLRESTFGELDITVKKVMDLHNLRDALHPVWKLIKDGAGCERKEVKSGDPS